MKLRNVSSNVNELVFNSGIRVLFSYATPVAAYVPGKGFLRSVKTYSSTTSRHVSRWIGSASCQNVEQEVIDNLVN